MAAKATAISAWVRRRSRSSCGRSAMSTHHVVVNAVSALSALEKLAATMPMVKNTTTAVPKRPDAAKRGSKSSVNAGSGEPCCAANCMSNTPRAKNNKLAGKKANP